MPQPAQLTAVHNDRPTGIGEPTIEVNGLGKTYPGGVEAVRAIDFSVSRGEVFGLLGPNGAGKSTTVGMLTTTILPTAGTARVAGFDVVRAPLQARRAASVVFQEPVVDRPLSGRRNLELHGALWGLARAQTRERVQRLAGSLGLSELLDRPVGSYSGGQRRRLEIARALVSEPSVLFLDEPTVGLDPLIRRELLDAIARLRDETEMTILLTTHYLEEAERLCDRVAIMHDGSIVALDTPSALLGRLGRDVVELRVAGDGDAALGALLAERIAGPDAFSVGSTITVPLDGITVTQALAAIDRLALPVTAVSTRPPTLDDVYVRMTDTRLREAA